MTMAMAATLVVAAPAAQAQSTSDLQAQIAALLAQIAQLQAQLNAQTGGTSTSCYSFTRDLTVGSTGTDVMELQKFLNAKGYTLATSGAGAPGSETTYFGSRTQAAVSKFQAANGISPTAGYFGPITRAKVNSLCTVVVPPTTPPGTPPPVPGAGLSVSLSASNPAAGSLISSSASASSRVPVLAVNFTAGTASGITVNDVSFAKNGVLSDSSISGAYVEENGKVLAQYNSITSGKINFLSLGLNIAAGQTRTLWLSIDPATGLSAGNTVSFSLASAADVKAVDANNAAVTPSGVLPANGNIFTVTSVSNPSLATLTVASSSVGTEVTAGTNDNVVGAWNFTGANSAVWLKALNFKVIGSANKSDIRNVKLVVNGTNVGPTLASVSSDGTAFFDMASAPAKLNTGSNSIQVRADITGSPSYNFQFEILNSYDILAVDSQYNVPVSSGSNTGTQISIKTGAITLQVTGDTPTGNIAPGQTSVTLAKFSLYAAGESVKVKWLGWGLNLVGASTSIDNYFKNVAMVDDAGGQLGSTINTLSTAVTCTDTTQATTSTAYRSCFGSSGSPINYIIPANTTRVLSIKADVVSGASFTSAAAIITANTSNLQGLTSSQTASTGSANGSALNLTTNALTVAKNTGVGTQTITANSVNKRIGSYTFTASSAEGVKVSTVTVTTGAAGSSFQNLKVMVGGTQFGSTQATLSNSTAYTFSGTQFTVPKGQSITLDVYADVLSSATAGTKSIITVLSGCSANGETSLTSITCSSTNGQDVVVAGQATIQVAVDSATPAASQYVMGTLNNHLATFRLTETSNIEDVKINDLIVFDVVAGTSTVKSAFSNVKLYKSDGTLMGTSGSATDSASSTLPGRGRYYKFNFSTPIVVPQSNSISLLLKADVSSYTSSGATDNTTHVFRIASSTDTDNDAMAGETVNALGNTSNATSAVTLATGSGAPTANTATVLRSRATVAGSGLGASSGRAKASVDQIGSLTFTADAAGSVAVNTITVTFGGTAPSLGTFLDGVILRDANNANVTALSGLTVATSSVCDPVASACTKSWNFGAGTAGYTVSAGSSYTFRLEVDSTKTKAAANGVSQTLSATITANTDITYTDALDSAATTNISLPANAAPVTINSVAYAAGS